MHEGHGTGSRSVVCVCVCVCVCVGWSPTEGSFFFSTLEIPSLNPVNFSVVAFFYLVFYQQEVGARDLHYKYIH